PRPRPVTAIGLSCNGFEPRKAGSRWTTVGRDAPDPTGTGEPRTEWPGVVASGKRVACMRVGAGTSAFAKRSPAAGRGVVRLERSHREAAAAPPAALLPAHPVEQHAAP